MNFSAMAQTYRQTAYFDFLARRNWGSWIFSILAALGLTLGLFMMMPCLMDNSDQKETMGAIVDQINVIRVKRPDSKVEKKKPVKKPEPRKVEVTKQPVARVRKPIEFQQKILLPFEINPKLPTGPSTLELPVFEAKTAVGPAGMPGMFSIGDLDASLTTLARIPPIYPGNARRRGIEGWVRVSFTVNEGGHVEHIQILEADPAGIFERAVEKCVAGWRFSPPTVGGLPVKTKVETTIRFELN